MSAGLATLTADPTQEAIRQEAKRWNQGIVNAYGTIISYQEYSRHLQEERRNTNVLTWMHEKCVFFQIPCDCKCPSCRSTKGWLEFMINNPQQENGND